MFYLSEQNVLQEWALKDDVGSIGSSSELGIVLSDNSNIVSYWPSVVYQTATGDIQEMVLNGAWNIRSTQNKGQLGSSLVELPYWSDYPDGGNHVLYQKADGTLGGLVGNTSAGWATKTSMLTLTPLPYTHYVLQAKIISDDSLGPIPEGSSIGGFTVSNKQTQPDLDTYVLYQEIDGSIQVTWQDDKTGWKGPISPSAFQGADNRTSIACLTPMAWPGSPLPKGALQTCRCYFQSSGSIKEVWYDGTAFNLVGDVPTT